MSFLADYDNLSKEEQVTHLFQLIGTKPEETLAILQEERPIIQAGQYIVLTKYADCVEILSRHTDFSVKAYSVKMNNLTGPFFLGEDNTEIYERDTSSVRLAMRRSDLPAIRSATRRCAEALLANAKGDVELVSLLTRRVPAEIVGPYLGVSGPDLGSLQRWTRELFREIFTNLQSDPIIAKQARIEAEAMRRYVDDIIRSEKENPNENTVLGRLLTLCIAGQRCLAEEAIRHNLIGLIVGAVETTSKSVVHALDVILRQPDIADGAVECAIKNDLGMLGRYCSEALRLKPQNTLLVRVCERPVVIAAGTARETRIDKNEILLIGTSAAMRDPAVVDRADQFDLCRAENVYLHFGVGLHSCFGRFIGEIQIVELVRAVLRLPGIRRAEGEAGEIRYDGPFPDAFHVVTSGHDRACEEGRS